MQIEKSKFMHNGEWRDLCVASTDDSGDMIVVYDYDTNIDFLHNGSLFIVWFKALNNISVNMLTETTFGKKFASYYFRLKDISCVELRKYGVKIVTNGIKKWLDIDRVKTSDKNDGMLFNILCESDDLFVTDRDMNLHNHEGKKIGKYTCRYLFAHHTFSIQDMKLVVSSGHVFDPNMFEPKILTLSTGFINGGMGVNTNMWNDTARSMLPSIIMALMCMRCLPGIIRRKILSMIYFTMHELPDENDLFLSSLQKYIPATQLDMYEYVS